MSLTGGSTLEKGRPPPGGRAGAAYGPALGGEADSVLSSKDSCKVPPYATTSVGFATTSCESRIRFSLQRNPDRLQHNAEHLASLSPEIPTRT